jgi:hypothetical protein
MKFIDAFVMQQCKNRNAVCGDTWVCERSTNGTLFVVADGIGSGVYANIAAIVCASRIAELYRSGVSIREISEMVASSMHRARKEDIPFSAFTAVAILPGGQFTAYAYEAPSPILFRDNWATVLSPRFYTAGFEVIGEMTGVLREGDALMLFSDGVSQAGLGHGLGFGIGSDGVAKFSNKQLQAGLKELKALPVQIMDLCKEVSANRFEDDTTLGLLVCRKAEELTMLTGPPSKRTLDSVIVSDFMELPGKKVVCGSTTADIVSRELKREAKIVSRMKASPEYHIEGIDLVAEGAVTLNQAYNLLGEPIEEFYQGSPAERLCLMLTEADVIRFLIGNAQNAAHEDLFFRQIGVKARQAALKLISEKLVELGKQVVKTWY